MELKLKDLVPCLVVLVSSNCTNMELKHAITSDNRAWCLLLIAPIWNWNHFSCSGYLLGYHLLIAPIWNWNTHPQFFPMLKGRLLIAPIWNWNSTPCRPLRQAGSSSNCTNMELKHLHNVWSGNFPVLLIAPIWNWNWFMPPPPSSSIRLLIAPIWNWNGWSAAAIPILQTSSNCTNMELKHVVEFLSATHDSPF